MCVTYFGSRKRTDMVAERGLERAMELAQMTEALRALSERVTLLEGSAMTVTQEIRNTDIRIQVLESLASKPEGKSNKKELIETKAFQSLTVYDGNPGDYDRWAFLLRQRLVKHDAAYVELLDWLKKFDRPPTAFDLDEYILKNNLCEEAVHALSKPLWDVVCDKVGPNISTLLTNAESSPMAVRGLVVLQKYIKRPWA